MSDHAEQTDHGKVFAVMLFIGSCVLIPALYGMISGALTN